MSRRDGPAETDVTLRIQPADPEPVETEQSWGEDEVALSSTLIPREGLPVFEGVRVVYLGSRRRMALALKGVVHAERFGDQVAKTVGRTSRRFSNYVFWRLDEANQPISKRLMPETFRDAAVRGRPFCFVEHPEHLYYFARRPEEFRIFAAPAVMRALEEYIARRERARRGYQQFEQAVTA